MKRIKAERRHVYRTLVMSFITLGLSIITVQNNLEGRKAPATNEVKKLTSNQTS